MTTPTNWPNPERIGEPMFPERDGWHVMGLTTKLVKWWDASNKYWWDSERRYYLTQDEVASSTHAYRYHGPVLTPTQIAKMLEAERESDLHCALMDSAYMSGMKVGWNCAQNDDIARYNSIKERIIQDRIDSGVSFSKRTKAIRNLGAAS